MIFSLTNIGKQSLAELLVGETLEINGVIITDAYTTNISDIEGEWDLDGNSLFSSVISGTVSDNNMHIEFADTSTTEYTAKTMAIGFSKDGTNYILAIATNSVSLFQKGSMPLQAVIDITFEDASSISFNSTSISFPSATDASNGTVRYATAEEIASKTGNGVLTAGMLNQIISLLGS